jgi:hypothetical protein
MCGNAIIRGTRWQVARGRLHGFSVKNKEKKKTPELGKV